ncbi:hypothetical protein HDF15_003494 [Granulicella mallensis]|uniref:Uncharacterized protein n=1 Tax=Granulicella mallensis TaxID=940614 RepID=A0A7W8EAW1_9BACT|nr:hypothetical protein [Granulicella mallensis]
MNVSQKSVITSGAVASAVAMVFQLAAFAQATLRTPIEPQAVPTNCLVINCNNGTSSGLCENFGSIGCHSCNVQNNGAPVGQCGAHP